MLSSRGSTKKRHHEKAASNQVGGYFVAASNLPKTREALPKTAAVSAMVTSTSSTTTTTEEAGHVSHVVASDSLRATRRKAKTWNCVECGDLLTASNTLTSDQYNYYSIPQNNQQQQRSLSWDRKTANLRRSETRFTRFTKPRVMSMKGSYTDQIVCICLYK